ncbi:MAG: hypothetical protein KDA83_18205 [Planctomycetales bacterium]|nr:hypothetical protein [Planctomycetales bacterium]
MEGSGENSNEGTAARSVSQRAAACLHAFEAGCLAYRRFVLFLIIICTLLVGGWWVARKQLGPIVRPWIERKATELFADRGLEAQIGSADFVEGQGLWLRNVSLASTDSTGPALLHVDELLIRTDQTLWNIARHGFQPQRILVRHLRANLTPEADGSYAAERLWPLPQGNGNRVPISIVDAALTVGGSIGPWRLEEHITNLQIEILPPAEPNGPEIPAAIPHVFQISAELQTTRIGKLRVEGRYDESTAAWTLGGDAHNLRLSTDLIRVSEELAGQSLSDIARLDAGIDLEFRVEGVGLGSPTNYWAAGTIVDGRLDDARLPDPIVNLEGSFEATPERWRLEGIRALVGQGRVSVNAERNASSTGDHWVIDGWVDGVNVDRRLEPYIPPSIKHHWDEYRPTGVMDACVHVEGGPGGWHPNLDLTLHDVSFVYAVFPYPVHHCQGTVSWSPERLRLDIEGRASGSRVVAKGEYQNPGANSVGRVDIELLDQLPISEELMHALRSQPGIEHTVRQFSPKGQLGVTVALERHEAGGDFHRTYQIEIFDGSLRYEGLPYNLHGVTGKIIVQDDWMYFQEIRGHNGSGLISCSGSVGPDRWLNLSFEGSSLPLDEELRRALPDSLKETWDNMRPAGHLDHLDATYRRQLVDQTTELTIKARMWDRRSEERTGVSVRPVWMPFTWHELTGSITYDNGEIAIDDLRGHHGETTISVQGVGRTNTDGWWLDLSPCSIDRIEPTAELLESLPPIVKQGLRTIELSGRLNLHGRIAVLFGQRDPRFTPPLVPRDSGGAVPPHELEVQWDQTVDLERAGLTIAGHRLHDAYGTLKTVGVMMGERMESFGQLELDSLMWRDTQIRDVRGPLYLDSTRVAFGSMASQATERATPRPLSGSWLGGRVQVDGQMQFDNNLSFMVQGSIGEGRLEAARDEFGWNVQDLSGAIYAGIRLEGSGTDANSLAGHGRIELQDATIYELPLMVNLLKLLSIRQVDRTAFTTSTIDYRIERDRVELQRVELAGDAISLAGSGELDFSGRLQAQFYTRVGRQELKLPILSPLVGAASRQFLLIRVDGSLYDPQVTQVPFPKINDAIQAMTAEPTPAESLLWPGTTMPPAPNPSTGFGPSIVPESWR